MKNTHEIIEAFADGELVDPNDLLQALAKPGGPEELVDLLVLRGLMGGAPGTRAAVAPTPPRSRVARWLAIAALVSIAVTGGFFAGRHRAATTGEASPATMSVDSTLTAPSPTRVIRLENGVDWNEKVGGR